MGMTIHHHPAHTWVQDACHEWLHLAGHRLLVIAILFVLILTLLQAALNFRAELELGGANLRPAPGSAPAIAPDTPAPVGDFPPPLPGAV
jgi:hypothetical protein